jgi:ATP-dependent DNA ligase
LLYLNGYDLRKLPLLERKAVLKKLITGTSIQFSESFEIDGQEMYQHACSVGLEGVVAKVRDSKYPFGRSNDWLKKTCAQRETLTIAGFALDGSKWDGLYLGRRKGDDLVYAGEGRPRLRQRYSEALAGAAEAIGQEDPAVCQADRASRHLGRAGAVTRDRVSREVGRGEGSASGVQGIA